MSKIPSSILCVQIAALAKGHGDKQKCVVRTVKRFLVRHNVRMLELGQERGLIEDETIAPANKPPAVRALFASAWRSQAPCASTRTAGSAITRIDTTNLFAVPLVAHQTDLAIGASAHEPQHVVVF